MVKNLIQKVSLGIQNHRAENIYPKIERYIDKSEKVLDLGAGDCLVAKRIYERKTKEITVIDVESDSNLTDLPLIFYDGIHLPFEDETFDVALLLYVLHHCDDPKIVLEEVKRVVKKKVIILEDLFYGRSEKLVLKLLDWYLGKVEGMPTPANFRKPEEWMLLFNEVGFNVKDLIHLGRDDKLFPVRHIFFLLSP
ncbi:methyltransferase domain-containing protein [bacterium]|nr:methyltransferase domain-containing protein [bacterium]